MTHDTFPFVNVFAAINILTRNYHEFLFYFKFIAIYYVIYDILESETRINVGLNVGISCNFVYNVL